MNDPLLYTVEELLNTVGNADSDRLLATARAAAEADSLRARLDKLQAFKDYVHQRLDAAGVPADPEADKNAEHGCRIEGRLNFVEATADSLRSQLEEARKEIAAGVRGLQDLASMVGPREAGWSDVWSSVELLKRERDAAQGEVAVLRVAMSRLYGHGHNLKHFALAAMRWDGDDFSDEAKHIARAAEEAHEQIRTALASTRATADAHDERVRREAIVWWVNHGTVNTTTDEALRALAHPDSGRLYCAQCSLSGRGLYEVGTCPGTTSVCIEAREARALAHPTKEPQP